MTTTPHRNIVLDLFILNDQNQIAAVERNETDVYEKNLVSAIILIPPLGIHPIKYIQDYLQSKQLTETTIKILPALYLNQFDTEANKDYLVLSFKTNIQGTPDIPGDKENPQIKWMTLHEFTNHAKLMPEFKRSNTIQILSNKSLFYKGYYKESDHTYDVIKWEKY